MTSLQNQKNKLEFANAARLLGKYTFYYRFVLFI